MNNNTITIDLSQLSLTDGQHNLVLQAITRDGLTTKLSDSITISVLNGAINTQVPTFQMYEGDPLEGLPADCPQWVIDRVSQTGWVQPSTREEFLEALNRGLPIKIGDNWASDRDSGVYGFHDLVDINTNYVIIDFNNVGMIALFSGWSINSDNIALIDTNPNSGYVEDNWMKGSELYCLRNAQHEFSTEPYISRVHLRFDGVY